MIASASWCSGEEVWNLLMSSGGASEDYVLMSQCEWSVQE